MQGFRFNVSIDAQEEIPTLSHIRTTSFGSPQSPVTPYRHVSKENEHVEKVDVSPAFEEGQTSAEHAIDLDRIRQGLDVRSTVSFHLSATGPDFSHIASLQVMIRNIPNKITSVCLSPSSYENIQWRIRSDHSIGSVEEHH